MEATAFSATTPRYARCIETSKRIRWDIDRDVIRGRRFELDRKYLPDSLSCIDEIDFLGTEQQRFLSQVQGRTYANMFGLVERSIGAKMLEVSSARSSRGDSSLPASSFWAAAGSSTTGSTSCSASRPRPPMRSA